MVERSNRCQHRVLRGWLLLSLALAGASCSRTPLSLADPCSDDGQLRDCTGICGAGTQVCAAGKWQACVVPSVERVCDDECGAGTQICSEEEGWGECQVAPVSEACENECGTGERICRDNAWGECQVAPVSEACEDECGTGERICRNNAWGECQVAPVSEACENECGTGERVCRNDVWGDCEVEPVSRPCASACGDGQEWCEEGRWGACDAPQPGPPRLNTIVRDLKESHPDFENDEFPGGVLPGLVEEYLGPDDKPVRVPAAPTITSDASFVSWYNFVPGVNLEQEVALQLEVNDDGSSLFEFRDRDFFPIDDVLWGNEGYNHNYHFTLEAATEFRYVGGEIFRFIGDDDLWVFVNRRLAIDLGSLHQTAEGFVALDAIADDFGLELGELYPLHIFFAERHRIASNFVIESSIAGPGECD